MSIDMTKLTPLPVSAESVDGVCKGDYAKIVGDDGSYVGSFWRFEDAEFYVLARNAFDVMMWRKWTPVYDSQAVKEGYPGWCVQDENFLNINCSTIAGTKSFPLHNDPFTALVEADKWYSEHVENNK